METKLVSLRLPVDLLAQVDALEGSRTDVVVGALRGFLAPSAEPLVRTEGARPPIKLPNGGTRDPMNPCPEIGGVAYEEAFAVMSHHPSQRDPAGWKQGKYRN